MSDGPNYIATKQIPRVEVPENTITAVLVEVRAMRADVSLLVDDVRLLKDRVTLTERRLGDYEERATKNSIRAQSASQTDLEHARMLAEEETRRKALEVKVDTIEKKVDENTAETVKQTAIMERMENRAKAFFGNPIVRTLLAAAGTAAAAYFAGKGH